MKNNVYIQLISFCGMAYIVYMTRPTSITILLIILIICFLIITFNRVSKPCVVCQGRKKLYGYCIYTEVTFNGHDCYACVKKSWRNTFRKNQSYSNLLKIEQDLSSQQLDFVKLGKREKYYRYHTLNNTLDHTGFLHSAHSRNLAQHTQKRKRLEDEIHQTYHELKMCHQEMHRDYLEVKISTEEQWLHDNGPNVYSSSYYQRVDSPEMEKLTTQAEHLPQTLE